MTEIYKAAPVGPRKVIDYVICCSVNVIRMKEKVLDHLKIGYVLYGSPYSSNRIKDDAEHCQAVVRYE